MKKPAIIIGLDIGSSKISGVAAEAGEDGLFTIVAHASYPSGGVSRGAIVNLDEAVDAVSRVLSKLSAGTPAPRRGDVYVTISGQSLKGERSRGMVPLSLRGREVVKGDMERCVNAASTIRLSFDREIVHKIVQDFSIDDQPWIKNPLGLYASRLACEIYVITANVNHIQSIYKCVNNAGYDVKEVVFTGIADGEALLDTGQKEEGSLLLGMGASLTEISVFSGGILKEIDVAGIGSADFRGELKDLKEFNDIVSRVKGKIDEFSKRGEDIRSVILTGGMAFVDGAAELLEERLAVPVKVATVRDVRGNISSMESMKVSTAIGAVKYACAKLRKKTVEEGSLARRLSDKVVDIFNNYF
ncbi:MAG: hypothetical protein WC515_01735 [Candidatus Omnitrophota bacterium]